ncbi:atpI [Symbiodinium necroappetens]|uniref:AtpI protein n=1 Tax=Symbiodinium necroappetens TaxID=1628268 RepID=A0A812VQM8_9DINO|nr:atpI [Symbiodinium necroappetens]
MPRICSQRGCNIQLSRARIENGLTRCARHGRQLQCGNPVARRDVLTAPCTVVRGQLGLWAWALACERTVLSSWSAAPTFWLREPGMGVLAAVYFFSFCGSTKATRAEPTRCPAMRHIRANAPPELLLLNAALARRLSPEAAATLGWQTTWSPGGVLQTLVHFHGSLLSENHHISIRNQASLNVATRLPRDRFTFVSWGSTGAKNLDVARRGDDAF